MADDTTKAAPTLTELEGKVERLRTQESNDAKLSHDADAAFANAVKKGDVDKALELADARSTSKGVTAKSTSQLETAKRAVASAKHAANADKVAAIHDQMRDSREVDGYFTALAAFGVTRVTVERSDETGKLLVNSIGPSAPKRSGGGGGGKGQPLTVDGQVFPSAAAALQHHFPEFTGKVGVEAIAAKLKTAGHTVA